MKPSRITIKAQGRVLGLDVAKASVVLFDPVSGRTWSVANNATASSRRYAPSPAMSCWSAKPPAAMSVSRWKPPWSWAWPPTAPTPPR